MKWASILAYAPEGCWADPQRGYREDLKHERNPETLRRKAKASVLRRPPERPHAPAQ
jgi:hypothetical protein